jgi:hypothetical protein
MAYQYPRNSKIALARDSASKLVNLLPQSLNRMMENGNLDLSQTLALWFYNAIHNVNGTQWSDQLEEAQSLSSHQKESKVYMKVIPQN